MIILRGVLSNFSMHARQSQVLGLLCAWQRLTVPGILVIWSVACRLICQMGKQNKSDSLMERISVELTLG